MIKFDLETAEGIQQIDTSEIDSVLLSLNVFLTRIEEPAVCSLHTIDYDWEEMEVCWNFASNEQTWYMTAQTGNDDTFALEDAGDMDIDPVATTLSVETGEWQSWNVTDIIKFYIENPEENHGFMIRSSGDLQPHYFYSSDHDSVEIRPRLLVYTNGAIANKYKILGNNNFKHNIQIKNSDLLFTFQNNTQREIQVFDIKGKMLEQIFDNNKNVSIKNINKYATNIFLLKIEEKSNSFVFKIAKIN